MINLQRVSKVFQSASGEVRALDDLTLEIAEGRFVAVRGPSGSGKSTLLSLVGGLALPTSGAVTVAGNEISAMSSAERARFRAESLGFVFQMFHLLPYLNVVENVLLASLKDASDANVERARELLHRFGLAERISHRPGQLSAGERQRVAMARAMLNEPKLVLADEPTGNLDPGNAKLVLDSLAEFHADGGTVLLVTHDELATGYADEAIELTLGQLDSTIEVEST